MMNSKEHRPVSLEDLLRLKRAERPSPAFWTKFESELRAKQLAAIVEKAPWWRRLSATVVVRHRLALSASAVLAIALVVVQSNHVGSELVVTQPGSVSSVDEPGLEGLVAGFDQGVSTQNSQKTSPAPSVMGASESGSLASSVALVAAHEQPAGGIAQAIARSSEDEDISDALSPVAQSIANNLAAVKEAHPELSDRFFAVSGFDLKSLMPSRQVVDPLSQMRSPADIHRERLLASARPISVAPSAHNSERIARRISDQRLTEEAIRRFGARGNELSLKF